MGNATTTPLLEWHTTEVFGRVAPYGVGGDGPSILFLHGWGTSGHTYRAALKRLLAQGFRVWAPSLPGFDGSAALASGADDLAQYAVWVDAFCDAVGIAEPVVLMGHSFGGAVAIQVAHDCPDRVRGLVLINSVGGGAWPCAASVLRTIQRPPWSWGLHLPKNVLPLRRLRRVLPVMIEAIVPNAIRDPRGVWHAANVARFTDLTRELQALKARRLPVAVLWGNRDALVTRASFAAMCEQLGDPLTVTVEGGHSWLIADPDAFGAVITNLIPVAMSAGTDTRAA